METSDKLLADLALFDAAPEMYTALEMALRRLIDLGAEDDKETIGPCEACDAVRAAMKKAKPE